VAASPLRLPSSRRTRSASVSSGSASALADDGGDAYPAQVGADAIRAVHSGIAC
jgi:hypothetical protein